jgi:hypothetical protein
MFQWGMSTRILILGASYGSLPATKLALAGHRVTLVCTRPTAELINREGTVVRFPLRGRSAPLDVASKQLPGGIDAAVPDAVDPAAYDLVILGMQEAQYGAGGVRELMERIAEARRPCLAIMNMPPLPFLRRLTGLWMRPIERCYADPEIWEGFDPSLVTLASPDPQAFRPPERPKNFLQVGLPTNFKAARFDADGPTALLRKLADDIERARLVRPGETLELPVKLKVHDSLYVPLAKWPMLVAGNYRCIRPDHMISIREAVHGDVARSREIYEWTAALCMRLGAAQDDLVPFEKYAQAADGLAKPSSAARALFAGAPYIERVDRLVHCIARQLGEANEALDEVVALVDERLERNRLARERAAA